jgi:hypothetical protein
VRTSATADAPTTARTPSNSRGARDVRNTSSTKDVNSRRGGKSRNSSHTRDFTIRKNYSNTSPRENWKIRGCGQQQNLRMVETIVQRMLTKLGTPTTAGVATELGNKECQRQ